jgi:CDP-paratose 2-epimerase
MASKYLITGGMGFIGSNYVNRLLGRGEEVIVYDNLSRSGAPKNLAWLRQKFGDDSFRMIVGDIRDASLLMEAVCDVDVIIHLASQVAVTTSVLNPREDFEINALGTFNLLEAARLPGKQPVVLYASTNKVYGGMENVSILETGSRYQYASLPLGIPETQPLDFHSPYGCSKGAGDQYTRDYHRIYGLPTVVFRQSCIYGPRQFGVEDQGWVAWFIIALLTGKPITIYGNGKQVRDLLYVEDLLDAYDAALGKIDMAAGQVYNIGGGAQNTISVWEELQPILEQLRGQKIEVKWGDWRPGDQLIYMSDTRKSQAELGWQPKVGVSAGIQRLFEWARENQQLFE